MTKPINIQRTEEEIYETQAHTSSELTPPGATSIAYFDSTLGAPAHMMSDGTVRPMLNTADQFTFPATATPVITQAAASSTGAAMTIKAQAAGGSNKNGGGLVLSSGAKSGSGADGSVSIQVASANELVVTGTTVTVTPPTVQFAAATAAPAVTQLQAAAGNGANMTVAAQAAFGTGDNNGGNLVLGGGAKNGSGTDGSVVLKSGASTIATVSSTGVAVTGNVSATELQSVSLDSGSNADLKIQRNNVDEVTIATAAITVVPSTFQFAAATTTPAIGQVVAAGDADGATLSISAQTGGTKTSNDTKGGSLSIASGAAGSGSSGDVGTLTLKTGATTVITADKTGLTVNSTKLGFFAGAPASKPTVAGVKADSVAGSILTALVSLGLVTDTTT